MGTSPRVPFLAGHGRSWVRLIDVISAEGQRCQPEPRGLWEGTGISGLASHNTAFLPDLQHPPSRAHPRFGLQLAPQPKNQLVSHPYGKFLHVSSPSVVLWEGALLWSLWCHPLPTGVQWDVDATRDLLVLEADGGSWLLKDGGTGSPEQPELTPG